jgi:Bul1 C terminus
LSLGEGFEDFVVSKTKALKKGMFSGKLGRITVSAAQPSAFVLPAPAAGCTTSLTTMATVKLRFDPHDATSQPPRLGGLTTKIKATTFYAARPAQSLPTHFNMVSQFETTRGVYDCSTPLSSRCVESVAWKRQEPRQLSERRNSDTSTSSSDFSDDTLAPEQKKGNPYYTASVLVPITLPTNKTWIPTFHSCIVSRVYAIDLSLSVHTPGAGVPATSVVLHLPVQIAANGNQTQRAELTAAEAAAELADANAFMQPRVIEVPHEELIGNSVLAPASPPSRGASELPPSYEDFVSQPRAVVLV